MYMSEIYGQTPGGWAVLLRAQRGIVDRGQTRRVGLSEKALRHRLTAGRWRRLQRGVYATFTGEVTREARLWAAVRRAGAGAMLSHETAAEVHGLVVAAGSSAKIHVTVPWRRRPAQNKPIRGVVVHRSDRSRPESLPPWELPRTRIEDTVLDLIATSPSFSDAYSWVSRATSRRLATTAMLREAMKARSRIRWRAWLTDALAEASDGVFSPLELRYARDVERAHGLPEAQRQARMEIDGKVHYKDNLYLEFGLCVEVDGPAFHQHEQAEQDRRRDNLNLARDGVQTFRFGPVEVTELACQSAAMVAAALRRNGWAGPPRRCRRSGCTIPRKTPKRDTLRPPVGTLYPASSSSRGRTRNSAAAGSE
jgi:Transcriptional regulator, AbiEi antitoxin